MSAGSRLMHASAVALATTSFAAVLSGCGGSSSPVLPNRTAPLESIFEAGPQLMSDPAGALDTLRRLGVTRIRLVMGWSSIAPNPTATTAPAGFDGSDPGAYPAASWTPYDAVIRDAVARGIGVDLSLAQPPLWAAGPDAPAGAHPQWEPSPTDFGAFVRAVGTRYSGHYTPSGASNPLPRVDFWSIWNEPNYGPDLAPQAIDRSTVEVSPRLYRGLVDAAWTALRSTGHGGDTILLGELAPRGLTGLKFPGNFSGMLPLRFVRALYCVDTTFKPLTGTAATLRGCPATATASHAFPRQNPALFHASGFADHPYPQGLTPPTFVTPDEPGYADFAALPKLLNTLDRAQEAYRSPTRFDIWSTEFGYKTDPPLSEMASPAVASGLLNWSEYLTWRNPRLRSYDQYELVDPASSSGSEFVTGLEFADGKPKATYAAFRMPLYLPQTSFSPDQAVQVWGCVRPARYTRLDTGRLQRVQIQFRHGGQGRFTTVSTVTLTDPYGYFDVLHAFPASGAVRLAWSYPHGPEIFSRTVPVTAH